MFHASSSQQQGTWCAQKGKVNLPFWVNGYQPPHQPSIRQQYAGVNKYGTRKNTWQIRRSLSFLLRLLLLSSLSCIGLLIMSEVIAQQKLEQESPGKLGNTVTPENMTYDDSSGAIFSMYITQAQKLDEENVENWTGVADRILIFVRLELYYSWRFPSSYLPHRLAFSHLRWLLSFPSATRACSKIHT